MMDTLLEGKLLALIVGAPFRLVEILVRAVHLTVRGVRLLVQESIARRIDRRLSMYGKRRLASRTTVDVNSLVLMSATGEYDSDAKYIAEELLRRGAAVAITWVLRDGSVGPFPRQFHFVRYGTARFFRALAGAKVVVHEGGALRASGAVRSPAQQWLHVGRDAPASSLGHPRNDPLVDASADRVAVVRKKVLDRLGVAESGQRFLLYTPPRRTPASVTGLAPARVRDALSERFGGTWEILIRVPAATASLSAQVLAGLPYFCRDATPYPDEQELLLIADAAMSDRSGALADFLLTGRPAFVFDPHASGAERSEDLRALPRATSHAQLVQQVIQFDDTRHRERVERILAERGADDDGRAASRVVDEILGGLPSSGRRGEP
ncbi:MAG: CDP-glycerol glycerophosphotransferase family protein [Candidatus Microbacterium phytovorans]|uniref:CDP-glycerol glycerophosphotransferase family protein n=1 Tax=Candidatus Microbacterium phytovorans TaxID=3121374 RepID=A0AAJ5W2Z8_9MICO|nr:CDP-glycerol glycerophosphotransferase family protein [Microbacterium sp.]WEK13801.1 MAG: CDP-glycerol glycerophosphotransferase family protein [Microbacterium sp.]